MSTINTSFLSDHLPPALTADHLHSMKTSESKAQQKPPPLLSSLKSPPPCAAARLRRKIASGQFDEENPFVLISSVLLVQADEGVSFLVVDRIGDIYRNIPRRADVIVTTVGARHKCQQVQADEGVSFLVVDRIGDIYRNIPRRADVIVTTVGARHKCQQGSGFEHPMKAHIIEGVMSAGKLSTSLTIVVSRLELPLTLAHIIGDVKGTVLHDSTLMGQS
ncbi:hypothetical protein F511_31555 [Dorcoceras hygrometricum]|uniref:Uncharacterized protein n=1 Tax=Dorcoceras hygrometricum TaxID=472368 RepID=A0A2Z7CT01_9LAMI|nr:hypothetical protein F511_31555 [Dorcoceras hygrometricum]